MHEAAGLLYSLAARICCPPVPVISTPTAGTTWAVNDQISFGGSATDPQDGAVPASSELTPTEQRIAQLVGEGKKNREVADALFISVKTVEANLSRIFHKLGVRSRTELTRRIAATQRVSPDSSPLDKP